MEIPDMKNIKHFISIVEYQIYRTFFKTLYYKGLRQCECLALAWNDFINNSLAIQDRFRK